MKEILLFSSAQVIGGIAVILSFLVYQMQKQKSILITNTAVCFCMAVQYLLLFAYPGMATNFAGVARNIVYYKTKESGKRIYPIVMSLFVGVMGVIAWGGPVSLLVIVALMINSYAMSFRNPQHLRYSILITSPMVLIYNIIVFSFGGILLESVTIISAVVGIFRYRKKEEEKK